MQSGKDPKQPPVVLVMGVSGSGKTTVGSALAARLGWTYAEADSFHPPANVVKMRYPARKKSWPSAAGSPAGRSESVCTSATATNP